MNKNIKINLEKLQVKTRLGVYEEERKNPMVVEFDVSISLPKHYAAISDDNIDGYMCYDKVAELIYDFCVDKEFKLLEYLANQIFIMLKSHLPEESKLKLLARKSYVNSKYKVNFAACEISDD